MRKTTVSRLRCPECGSVKLVKNGMAWTKRRRTQRYRCNLCGRNTIAPRGL